MCVYELIYLLHHLPSHAQIWQSKEGIYTFVDPTCIEIDRSREVNSYLMDDTELLDKAIEDNRDLNNVTKVIF